ncbi:MAG: hypothetical protein V2A65_08065 [Candidatus Omnitrophota bacterium]
MKMKNENESSDYPRTYLEPSELYILKKLILLERDASISKQQTFTISEFVSYFDHRTVEPLYPGHLSYYTDTCTPAILITRFLYDLSRNGLIKFCDPLGRPGKLVLKKEGRKIVAELLAFAKHPNGGMEPYIYRIDTDFKFKIEFIEQGTKRMKQWLSKYLDLYIDNKLPSDTSRWNRKEFYLYVDALAFFQDLFKEKYEVLRDQSIRLEIAELIQYKNEWEEKTPLSGSPNWLDHWFDEPILRPMETILAMEKEGILEIKAMYPDEIVVNWKGIQNPKIQEMIRGVAEARVKARKETIGKAISNLKTGEVESGNTEENRFTSQAEIYHYDRREHTIMKSKEVIHKFRKKGEGDPERIFQKFWDNKKKPISITKEFKDILNAKQVIAGINKKILRKKNIPYEIQALKPYREKKYELVRVASPSL